MIQWDEQMMLYSLSSSYDQCDKHLQVEVKAHLKWNEFMWKTLGHEITMCLKRNVKSPFHKEAKPTSFSPLSLGVSLWFADQPPAISCKKGS